ncbi:hypothetical protein IF2G_08931 [Cordyceps javanica]|nr:hypothetical protein IF2G_08931 [Cordyceps javanica]
MQSVVPLVACSRQVPHQTTDLHFITGCQLKVTYAPTTPLVVSGAKNEATTEVPEKPHAAIRLIPWKSPPSPPPLPTGTPLVLLVSTTSSSPSIFRF